MSTVTYRHEQNHTYKKKGVKNTIREMLTDGEFLTLTFLKKVGDDDKNFYKLTVKETSKDKFSVREKKGETETEKETVLNQTARMRSSPHGFISASETAFIHMMSSSISDDKRFLLSRANCGGVLKTGELGVVVIVADH